MVARILRERIKEKGLSRVDVARKILALEGKHHPTHGEVEGKRVWLIKFLKGSPATFINVLKVCDVLGLQVEIKEKENDTKNT